MPVAIPQLLAPAGTLQKLRIALAYGADGVYVGAAGFSMRPDSAALSLAEIAEGAALTRAAGARLYVALNIMAFDNELPQIGDWLTQVRGLGIDGLIVGDAGVFALAQRIAPEIPLHISTQMGVANREAAAFWSAAGARRIVLARECPLSEAGAMAHAGGAEIEIFVHGAMCTAVSGRCLLSAHLAGSSGSRGECKHACRWEYQLVEQKRPGEAIPVFEEGGRTIFLGSRDLCLIEYIPQLVSSGVASLKIEGRMKSEYYVATVIGAYRRALNAYAAEPTEYRFNPDWLRELESVSHRPFSTGFAFGYPHDNPAALQCDNGYTGTHEFCGYVTAEGEVFVKNPIRAGENLEYISPGGGGRIAVERILAAGEEVGLARPASVVRLEHAGEELPVWSMLRRRKPVAAGGLGA